MTRFVRAVLLVAVCLGLGGLAVPGSGAADLHFQAVDSVQFPTSYSILQWRLADVNGDGYDELIAMNWDHYYVYSFANDSVVFKDSTLTGRFLGQFLTDYDHDGQLDIVTLDQWRQIHLQNGFETVNRRIIDTLDNNLYWLTNSSHGISIYLTDMDQSGDSELMLTGLEEFIVSTDPRSMEYFDAGSVRLLQYPSLMSLWYHFDKYWPSAEYSEVLNLSGGTKSNLCTWGHDFAFTSYYDQYYGWRHSLTTTFQFSVYDWLGNKVRTVGAFDGVVAIGGNFIGDRPGDEIIVLKDGVSFNSSVFNPGNDWGWGAYCLGIEGDSLTLLWGTDAYPVGQWGLFKLASLPHSFCAWNNSGQCRLFSGADGSLLGTVEGLRSGFETKEGRLRAGSDSLIQVVQVSGTKAILMEQMEPTDVSDDAISVPQSFVLRQNYPNPFNGGTTIKYALKRSANVKMEVLNLLGQVVATLADGVQSKGEKSVIWAGTDSNGHPVASGTYFAKISIGSEQGVIKMTLLK